LREVSGRLRLDYAQFLELEMFSRFGGLTDAHVAGKIARGQRIRALIAQPRFSALRTVDEIALLAALAAAVFDAVPAGIAAQVRTELAARAQGQHVRSELPEACARVSSESSDTDIPAELIATVRELVQQLTLRAAKGASDLDPAR
jgi:F-type H+-transporting ATPase subunit alpha